MEGKEGKEGKEGTFGGQTLPPGKTLTGNWAASGYGEEGFPNPNLGRAVAAVTYPLPLSAEIEGLPGEGTHIIKEGEAPPAECPGTIEVPAALPGNLCIFVESETNAYGGGPTPPAINRFGFHLTAYTAAKGPIVISGTWAVTNKE